MAKQSLENIKEMTLEKEVSNSNCKTSAQCATINLSAQE